MTSELQERGVGKEAFSTHLRQGRQDMLAPSHKTPGLRNWKEPRIWQPESYKSNLPTTQSVELIDEVSAPEPKLERNVEYVGRNAGAVYGNYVGPNGFDTTDDKGRRTAPLTPVDQVAYKHDQRYENLAREYDIEPMQFYKKTIVPLPSDLSLHTKHGDPIMQARAAAIDFYVGVDMLRHYGGAVESGWYKLDDINANARHKAFATDSALLVGMTMFEYAQGAHRLGLLPSLTLGAIGDVLTNRGLDIFREGQSVGGLRGAGMTLGGGLLVAGGYGLRLGAVIGTLAWSAMSLPAVGLTVLVAGFAGVGIAIAAYVGAKIVSGAVWAGKGLASGAKRTWKKITSWFVLSEAICYEMGLGSDVRTRVLDFRDQYVRIADENFLRRYYRLAPAVYEAIQDRPSGRKLWRQAYVRFFRDFLVLLDAGNMPKALEVFQLMFNWLCSRASIAPHSWQLVHTSWKDPVL